MVKLKPKLWLGLSAVGILTASVVFAAGALAADNEALINERLNLTGQKIDKIDSTEVEGSAYKDEDGSLSNEGWKRMIKDSYKFCEETVEQGSALLKNDNNVLPLKANERKVTLLGQGSKSLFMRSGAGGAAPNDGTGGTKNLVVKLDQAFEENGFQINHTLFDKYTEYKQSDFLINNSREIRMVEADFKDSLYNDAVKNSFREYGDAAIVTFMRIGTEDIDPKDGTLDLSKNETDLLDLVKQYKDNGTFKKVIVLINSPLPISMSELSTQKYGVDAVVYMGVPGYYGVGGVVHLLMGKDADGKIVNPSGHLPDTFANSASSSPAYVNFAKSSSVAVYKEGVYVGYKYYETRYADSVMGQGNANGTKGVFMDEGNWEYSAEMGYPFGWGMSYTTFKQKLNKVSYNQKDDTIVAEVEVENTGDMDGKASIQLYTSAPYTQFDKDNGLGKSAIALMAYDKVDVKAHEKVTKTISFDRYFLCTYDYKVNKTFILEGGTYYFALGNGAHEAVNNVLGTMNASYNLVDHNGNAYQANKDAVKSLDIVENTNLYATSHYTDEKVTNQFDDADYNHFASDANKITYLDRTDWEGTWPTTTTSNPANTSKDGDMRQYYKQDEHDDGGLSYTAGKGIDYDVPYYDKAAGKNLKITFAEMSKVPLEGKITEGRFEGMDGSEVWDAFIKQMDLDDLIISVADDRGILDVAKVSKIGNAVFEGPEGLLAKYQYGDKRWATGFPTGPTYTGTFDPEMQKKFGGFYGEDALYAGVACVNAPGANINRTPYGSRASEYASEDGIMNYNVAANIIREARKKGLIMNMKHCFLNNQETGRQRIYTYCNEQAIREIYLRPFEGGLTKGNSLGIMTSYNRIGARYAACHTPLMYNVMRKEWGYKGFIIDDALTGGNDDPYSYGPGMLYCGTDMFCLDGSRGKALRTWVKDHDDGTILRCLQRANKNIMYAMSRSWMGGVTVSDEEIAASSNPWWKKLLTGVTVGVTVIASLVGAVYVFGEVMDKVSPKAKDAE